MGPVPGTVTVRAALGVCDAVEQRQAMAIAVGDKGGTRADHQERVELAGFAFGGGGQLIRAGRRGAALGACGPYWIRPS